VTGATATPSPRTRAIVYALGDPGRGPGEHVLHALRALRPHAARLIVLHGGALAPDDRDALKSVADDVLRVPFASFTSDVYRTGLSRLRLLDEPLDETVLTGDSWFGPIREFGPVLERMDALQVDAWQMIDGSPTARPAFPVQGFAAGGRPWLWTAIRRRALGSDALRDIWASDTRRRPVLDPELTLLAALARDGFATRAAFQLDHPSEDPALVDSEELLDLGCPLLDRAVFTSYPPFLDRRAVLGREIAATVRRHGYPVDLLWRDLVKTTPPRILNTNAGMLEVLPDERLAAAPVGTAPRLAVVAHAGDLAGFEEILARLDNLPTRPDVFVSATSRYADAVRTLVEGWAGPRGVEHELRVVPGHRGRDMSAFFLAFRDVLLSDRYDLVIKLHSRRSARKSINRRRYFLRYQVENLLNSPGYVGNLLDLFRDEPGLGLVFPPMMHIGYSMNGRGWLNLEKPALRVRQALGISVPMDLVSPLAPFGGMWVGRPEALRLLIEHEWGYEDYARHGRHRNQLSRLQERLVAYAAAELGYHCRTVLTPEHAAISHTALDFKTDQLFSTTRDWPVDQITLMHRAGYAGYGGTVALARMYLRVNHPRAAAAIAPLLRIAYPPLRLLAAGRNALRSRRNERPASTSETDIHDEL
jgi:lipopolysaccharide biosynthesis protein